MVSNKMKKNAKKILIELLEFDFITIEDIKELINSYPIKENISNLPQITINNVVMEDSFSPSDFLMPINKIPKFPPKNKSLAKKKYKVSKFNNSQNA
jgi:hypothetical protein|tara:strand:+ start:2635 stop:2925 length:291 start_codon:yes stop_codon:yes gene_type:complete